MWKITMAIKIYPESWTNLPWTPNQFIMIIGTIELNKKMGEIILEVVMWIQELTGYILIYFGCNCEIIDKNGNKIKFVKIWTPYMYIWTHSIPLNLESIQIPLN